MADDIRSRVELLAAELIKSQEAEIEQLRLENYRLRIAGDQLSIQAAFYTTIEREGFAGEIWLEDQPDLVAAISKWDEAFNA